MNLIRIITALILAVLPVAATCCYTKYRGQSGRQMRILLWAHWTVTGLILVGYLCGALSMANWRLSPIVCTAFIVSMAFLRWAITKQKTMQRAAGVLCVPLACFCLLSACNVLLLPTNAEEVNVQYQLTNMLEKQGLTYGYATFWYANAITVISGEKLKVRNVSVNENGVQKAAYQTDSRWYEDQPEQKNYFLLLNNAEYQKLDERKDPLLNQAERSFVLTDSNGTTYQVLVFAKIFSKAILNKACSTAFPNSHEIITKCARILQKDVVCYCHHEKTAGICFPRFRQIPRRVFQHTAQRGVCIWKNPKSPKNHGSHTG